MSDDADHDHLIRMDWMDRMDGWMDDGGYWCNGMMDGGWMIGGWMMMMMMMIDDDA